MKSRRPIRNSNLESLLIITSYHKNGLPQYPMDTIHELLTILTE